MNEQPLLSVDQLDKKFATVHAVKNLGFRLGQGEVVGFLGCNGAGKTTTMAMLAGVLAADRGTVRIAGHDILLDPMAAKAVLGYLPEIPPLYPQLSVLEYLRFCARLQQIPQAQQAHHVDRSIERCDLGAVRTRLLGNLSKGYRQRAGIAQAIIHEPQLVILDEPTSGLDPAQAAALRHLIISLGSDRSVILSTHNLAEAQSTCNRILIIHEGRLRLDTPMSVASQGSETAGCDYQLTFQRPPDPEILGNLDPQISIVEANGVEVVLRMNSDGTASQPVLERVLGRISSQAWGLIALRARETSLEQCFMRLTCGHEADDAQ